MWGYARALFFSCVPTPWLESSPNKTAIRFDLRLEILNRSLSLSLRQVVRWSTAQEMAIAW